MGFGRPTRKASMAAQEAIELVGAKLEEAGCDPIKELAALAMSPATPRDEKIVILKELAQYIAPKRKSVEVTSSSDMTLTVYVKKFSKDPSAITDMLNPEVAEDKPPESEQK